MPRAKRGFKARRRRNKVLSQARGFFGRRKNTYRVAHETVIRSGVYAYISRRLRKRDYRRLWIQRINAGVRLYGLTYSRFVAMLTKSNVQLDRRVLAELAYTDPVGFKAVVDAVNR
jgi:large subunit ribosomal protein L20